LNDIRFWDAFAGVGGIRLGFEQASPRFKCVGGCEWDRDARYIYSKRFKHLPLRDITQIDENQVPDHDILTGGFPCQPFSHAGKRLGLEDTRGTLFFDLCRIAKAKRPRLLFFENVKGLLSNDGGRTFQTILNALDELGYDAEWQLLNSKHWIPQNRPRVFIVGHLRGKSFTPIFPLQEGKGISDQTSGDQQEGKEGLRGEVSCIDSRYGALRNAGETYLVVADRTRSKQGLGRNLESPKNITNSLTSVAKDNLLVMLSHTKANIKQRIQNRGSTWTVDTSGSKQGIIQPDQSIRRFTPLECERLQGFPDNWTQGLPDTERYHCIGNAVTVPVIKEIAKRILDVW